jgi:hypothetical protein
MTPRETFNVATAIQRLALISYPITEGHGYPSNQIALNMGKIAGLCHQIRQECLDLDPSIREYSK